MTAPINEKRLAELRMASELGMRMSAGIGPHTVQVKPEELAALVEEAYIARAREREHADITCRECGCTDNDCSGCIKRTGAPCFWVERDLCSACSGTQVPNGADVVARGLAVRHDWPGAIVIMLDPAGGLHIGCAAVDHPITQRFVSVARSIDLAIERGQSGFQTIAREKAVDLARACAKAKPQSYYAEPFEPHEWVIDAILLAASLLPPSVAQCSHCKESVCDASDTEAMRAHAMACSASLVVQELQRLRPIADQAEVVARHWEAQDGINGAELDKLRDIVFDRPRGDA